MKNFWQSIVLVGSMAIISNGGEVLNFSYDNFNFLQQNDAILHPDVTMMNDPEKCFAMGQTGTVEIPNISIPQEQFSIESRFYLDGYNELDPNISEILAAFDCGNGTEGVDFRVGGGYNYALKVQDLYTNFIDWSRPDESEKTARAAISKSMGEFSIGSGQGAWKEIFTDRCIDLRKWVHMVATWDGSKMLLYLNGHNATDNWRTVGSALPVNIAPLRNIMIGAETVAAWRHLNGKIGYVKVFDKAFSPGEVWQAYHASMGGERCAEFIKVESPRCGEVISRDTKIKFCVKDSLDNDVTTSGLIFTVQICGEPTFNSGVKNYSTTSMDCSIGELVETGMDAFDGLLYIRVSAHDGGGLSKMAKSTIAAESGTLATFLVSSLASSTRPVVSTTGLNNLTNRTLLPHKTAYDVKGRSVYRSSANAFLPLQQGVYLVNDSKNTAKKIVHMK